MTRPTPGSEQQTDPRRTWSSKKDARDGTYKLIEVNGRHNLSSELSVRCGVNFPAIQHDHLVHGRLCSPERVQTGVYWIGFPSLTNGLSNRRSSD